MNSQSKIYLVPILYLIFATLFYLIFFVFGLTSPSGIPNPLSYPFANNDFNFYRNFAINFPESFSADYKPGPIFVLLIFLFENILNTPDFLSPFFIVISFFYIIRLQYIFNSNLFLKSNKISVIYIFCPYLYYFTIFPSADILLAIVFAECIFSIISSDYCKKPILVNMIIICLLSVMIRPNGISICLIYFFYQFFNFYKYKNLIYLFNLIILTTIIIFSLIYYSAYKDVYSQSSSDFQNERKELVVNKLVEVNLHQLIPIYKNLDSSLIDKFFATFGLRISYETTAPGFSKNSLFSYARLISGIPLFLSFAVVLYFSIRSNKVAILLILSYFSLFTNTIIGVSFERYFIPIFPFLIQFFINFLSNKPPHE